MSFFFDKEGVFGSVLGAGGDYDTIIQDRLLAEEIPARSLPAGANPIVRALGDPANHNFNMQTADFQNGWPSERDQDKKLWFHSDLREVSYLYIHKIFDKFVELGDKKNEN